MTQLITLHHPELFLNLAQLHCSAGDFDLHNNFYCKNLVFSSDRLQIEFINFASQEHLRILFKNAHIVNLNLTFYNIEDNNLTLDSLYRGRFEIDGQLFEKDNNNRFYYYANFYEGPSLEFFCELIQICL